MTRRVWPVLIVSGVLGFLLGAFGLPTWQDVIEPAQVLAGVVAYPPDNPVYLYSTRTWTLLHQFVALWIAAGVPERTLTIVISGGVGLLSFQALALTSWAMGAPTRVAALVPMVVFAGKTARFDTGYPVALVGHSFTYGLIALGLLALLVALIASGRDRAAALILGVFPAVHLSVGFWAWVLVGLYAVPFRHEWIARARPVAGWFAAGLATTAVSAAVHFALFAPALPALPPGATAIIAGAERYWDPHRAALEWTSWSLVAAIVLPLLSLVWVRQFGGEWPRRVRWLPAGLAIAVVIGVTAQVMVTWLPGGVGHALGLTLPARLLNLPLFTYFAVVVGIATSPTTPASTRVLVGSLLVAVTLMHVAGLPGVLSASERLEQIAGGWRNLAFATGLATVVTLTLSFWTPVRARAFCAGWPVRVIDAGVPAAFGLLTLLAIGHTLRLAPETLDTVRDRTNNALLGAASVRPGVLLTASSLHLVQAATRRAVLIDGAAIDGLAYVPHAAPIADRIARRLYGLTLTALAPGQLNPSGAFPESAGRDLWTRWSLAEWQAIREEFDVTDVLTLPDWTLSLPLVARDEELALWTIPRR